MRQLALERVFVDPEHQTMNHQLVQPFDFTAETSSSMSKSTYVSICSSAQTQFCWREVHENLSTKSSLACVLAWVPELHLLLSRFSL